MGPSRTPLLGPIRSSGAGGPRCWDLGGAAVLGGLQCWDVWGVAVMGTSETPMLGCMGSAGPGEGGL